MIEEKTPKTFKSITKYDEVLNMKQLFGQVEKELSLTRMVISGLR